MATYQEKISNDEAEIQQLLNRIKANKQRLKAQQSKERTHRICQRGGYIEKVLPDTIDLTNENFQKFIDKWLMTKSAGDDLIEVLAEQKRQAAAEGTATATPTADATAANGGSTPTQNAAIAGDEPHHQQPKPAPSAVDTQSGQHPQSGANISARPPEVKRNAG
jgi:hypothetical protein